MSRAHEAQGPALLNAKLEAAEGLANSAQTMRGWMSHTERVGHIQRLIETAESAQRTAVTIARASGATWQEIADELGVTRQAAQQRYGA